MVKPGRCFSLIALALSGFAGGAVASLLHRSKYDCLENDPGGLLLSTGFLHSLEKHNHFVNNMKNNDNLILLLFLKTFHA